MTSQKRKSSLPGTIAKRPKLNEESQCPAVISRTRNGVTNKSTQFSTQKKNNNKSPANKAIRKSNLSQSEKKANLKVTKKNTVKNVPTKEKVLRITKDLVALKRKTEKSPSSASKVVKKSPSRVAKTETRRTSAQNQTSKTNNHNKSGTRKKTECLKKKSILKNKTDLKPRHAKKIVKITQNKAKNGDKQLKLNEQSKRSKQTSLNLKKQVPIVKTAEKNTKVDCKKGSNKPPRTQNLTSRRRTADKPSKQTQQKSVVSALSKKNSKSTEIEVTKRLTLRTRVKADHVKGESETTPTVGVSLVPKKERKAQSRTLSNKSAKKEVSVNGQSGSSSTNSSNKIATKSKTKAVSSTVPLKSKRDRTKPVVKAARNKLKNHKDVKTETDNNRPVTSAAEDQKSKRISILELCNEIAGEIESDTVEVAREVPSVPNIPVEESFLVENSEHSAVEVLPPCPALESPVNQSKRFFPSRKPPQLKCKREQKTSPGIKNYKWNKIKLKKNFAENNILRNPAVLPNLEMIRAKISPVQRLATSVLNDPKSPTKSSDSTVTTHLKLNKTVLSRMVKNNGLQTMVPRNVSENPSTENGLLENHIKHELEIALDEGFRLHLDSSPENSPMKQPSMPSSSLEIKPPGNECKQLTHQMAAPAETGKSGENQLMAPKSKPLLSEQSLQKEIRKLREADKASNSNSQPIIDAGQKRIGAISCHVCGMLYTASNPEDETQHLLFHNQFISAVRYVGWKKERIVAEYPDGKIIMVLPDDPKYALKKVEEIREMVDNDLGFQQVPLQLHSRTKTLLFISSDKKVVGCLIAEHIQWGYRVIDDFTPTGSSDKDQLISERVKAWCCSITPEPAICGVSRIWVFSMMRRKKIASRLLECLRSRFIYGSHLSKDEIAFSDPTPDGKLFATHYCGTSQFLVYNFVSGHQGS